MRSDPSPPAAEPDRDIESARERVVAVLLLAAAGEIPSSTAASAAEDEFDRLGRLLSVYGENAALWREQAKGLASMVRMLEIDNAALESRLVESLRRN